MPNPRIMLAALSFSPAALVALPLHAGSPARPLLPLPGPLPTIGFGTTAGVKMGDRITPPVALGRALQDITKFEGAIKQCVRVPLHQYEYDAYVSVAYNIGAGAFCNSTLVRKLNAGDYAGACAQISVWNKAGGRVVQGLVNRREKERAQCENRS